MSETQSVEGTRAWYPFNDGQTLGLAGSENGVTLADDEHVDGARITLEERCSHAPYAITCGIYGWMCHTRFFGDLSLATSDFESMKVALAEIVRVIPNANDPEADPKCDQVVEAIGRFVDRFP